MQNEIRMTNTSILKSNPVSQFQCSMSTNLTATNLKNYARPQGELRSGSELEQDWDDVFCVL